MKIMHEDWIDLKIDDLPSDYFNDNDYLFEWRKEGINSYKWSEHMTIADNNHMSFDGKLHIIKNIKEEGHEYRYCKPEPIAPTHKEIITKWWKSDSALWFKVICYYQNKYWSVNWDNDNEYDIRPIGYTKDDFTGRQSADTPPE